MRSPFRFARKSQSPFACQHFGGRRGSCSLTYVGLVGDIAHDGGDHGHVNEGEPGSSGRPSEVVMARLHHSYSHCQNALESKVLQSRSGRSHAPAYLR